MYESEKSNTLMVSGRFERSRKTGDFPSAGRAGKKYGTAYGYQQRGTGDWIKLYAELCGPREKTRNTTELSEIISGRGYGSFSGKEKRKRLLCLLWWSILFPGNSYRDFPHRSGAGRRVRIVFWCCEIPELMVWFQSTKVIDQGDKNKWFMICG